MNEQQFANKVRQALDEQARRLDPALSERLRAARERALANRRAERVCRASMATRRSRAGRRSTLVLY